MHVKCSLSFYLLNSHKAYAIPCNRDVKQFLFNYHIILILVNIIILLEGGLTTVKSDMEMDLEYSTHGTVPWPG